MRYNRPDGAVPQGPLLTSWIFIPPARLDLIVRLRLLEGARRKRPRIFTLAGFDHASFLSEGILHDKHSVTWVSPDTNNNALIRFWNYGFAVPQMPQNSLEQSAHICSCP